MKQFKYAYHLGWEDNDTPVIVNECSSPAGVELSEFPYTTLEDGSLVFPLEDAYLIYTDLEAEDVLALDRREW